MNWEMLAYVALSCVGIAYISLIVWIMWLITIKKLNNAEKQGEKKK